MAAHVTAGNKPTTIHLRLQRESLSASVRYTLSTTGTVGQNQKSSECNSATVLPGWGYTHSKLSSLITQYVCLMHKLGVWPSTQGLAGVGLVSV